MSRTLTTALCAVIACLCMAAPASATSRTNDLASVEGVGQTQLIGYGLVVGLNGTGNTLNNIPFTKQSLEAMLERLGVNIRGAQLRTGNIAAVIVTANLPPLATQGTRIDVTVTALGDSKGLQGGTLLVTPPCSAPTATSMRWVRAPWRSAASRRNATPPKSCAACRPWGAFSTPLSSNGNSTSH